MLHVKLTFFQRWLGNADDRESAVHRSVSASRCNAITSGSQAF